jgi:glycosyltransferase involved in cell wall biosynthesis
MKPPLVSIGLPFYNPGPLLADAIRSVFAQTFKNWELILLDDGSTDRSAEFALAIADTRVRVHSESRNLGLAARLNQLSGMARGAYLVRMDADDLMAPTRLEDQISFLAAHPQVDVVGTQAFVLNDNKELVGTRRIHPEKFPDRARCLRHGMVIHPTIMARTKWFCENRYDSSFTRAEDRELFVRVLGRHSIAQLDKLLHFYRVPSDIRLRAFLHGYRSERRVVLRYGPHLVGWARTAALLLNSFSRSALLPILVKGGLQTCVTRRLQGRGNLSQKEATDGSALLKHICSTPVPIRV